VSKLILTLVLLIGLNANAIEADKKLHLVSTIFISAATTSYFKAKGDSNFKAAKKGIYIANFVGLIKEVSDPFIDPEDLKYNLVGSIIGTFCVWKF